MKSRLETIGKLTAKNIPVNVMIAPVIPGLTSHEVPAIVKEVAKRGASSAACVMVRLNGAVAPIFADWAEKNYPDRAKKILNQIAATHGGKLNDSRFGVRMKGEGKIAENIMAMFKLSKKRYMAGRSIPPLNTTAFRKVTHGQLNLFD
ncbi:MAG: hypothetical protein JKX73_10850 [Flavobacteriales bacterium]|nr:hypothetical protein [Flavobacteriales bacterium]